MAKQGRELGAAVRHVHWLQRRAKRTGRGVAQQVFRDIRQLDGDDVAPADAEAGEATGDGERTIAKLAV